MQILLGRICHARLWEFGLVNNLIVQPENIAFKWYIIIGVLDSKQQRYQVNKRAPGCSKEKNRVQHLGAWQYIWLQ